MRKAIFIAFLVSVLSLGFAGTAKADSFNFTVAGTDGSSTLFTATVTSTDVTIVVSCLNLTCQGDFLSTVGLKGLSYTAVTNDPAGDPTGFSTVYNGQTNLGQTGDCNNTSPGSSVCWTTTPGLNAGVSNGASGTPLQIGAGGITFHAGLTNGSDTAADIHLQAIAFSSSTDLTGPNRVFAISNGPDTTTQTPEPASLMLLGLGLLGVPFLRRKK
jgi:hypothetical protein